ncbi:MAG: hypothetical protein R3F17_15105 [Planctomycetota bacterium]
MYRLFLAARYIRMRPINWIGTLSIFVAVGALILILAIMSGFLEHSREHLRGHLADVTIAPSFDIPMNLEGAYPPRRPSPCSRPCAARRRRTPPPPRCSGTACSYRPAARRFSRPGDHGHGHGQLVGIDLPDEYGVTQLREDLGRPVHPVAGINVRTTWTTPSPIRAEYKPDRTNAPWTRS